MYDLNLIPINLKQGEPLREFTGFSAAKPPRRAIRSRSEDMLVLSLLLKGTGQVPPERQDEWLQDLSKAYFKNSGSVTSVLRSLVEKINLMMLEMNLKMAKEGKAFRGAINLAAFHRRNLYIVQSGITHAFVLTQGGLQHFTDPGRTDRGLGLNRSPNVRFYQADLGTGDYLFMTDHPPSTWTEEMLAGNGFPDLDQLRRRLLHQAPTTFRLDLVQIDRGEGEINTIQPTARPAKEVEEPRPALEVEEIEEVTIPGVAAAEVGPEDVSLETLSETKEIAAFEEGDLSQGLSEEKVSFQDDDIEEVITAPIEEPAELELAEEEPVLDETVLEELEVEESASQESVSHEMAPPEPAPHEPAPHVPASPETASPEPASEKTDIEELPRASTLLPTSERLTSRDFRRSYTAPPKGTEQADQAEEGVDKASKQTVKQKMGEIREDSYRGLAKFFDGWHRLRDKVRSFTSHLFSRFSPEGAEGKPQFSKGTLILIAMIVPLIVVGISVGVYLARGKTQQYQYHYDRAQAASEYALAAQDPIVARSQWQEAIDSLDYAEQYRTTDELVALRKDAEQALDILDGAVRLSYRPAISGSLYSEINITRIISFGVDLYLLDSTGGRVIHATRGSQGYTIDAEFVCASGNFSGGAVDALVDMVSLPINNTYQAHILGVDALGNVAYCSPGQNPVVQSLPSLGVEAGSVQKIAYENNSLYVLNASNNALLVYRATNGQFLDPPYRYFEDAKPEEIPDISRTVDVAVNGPELYLLRQDGYLINCVYSGLPGNPVTCEDPVTYIDGRLGKEEQMVTMPEANFTSVLYTTPPDPSVSVLDATNADIYRFSLRFRLYQRMRPDLGDYEITSPIATAFTIGMDQVAIIAFSSQVFYAIIN